MTLAELGERMSAQEFSLWMHYHARCPIGVIRDDLHAGIVASTVANFAGKVMKEGRSVTPADFMPRRPDDEPDPAEHFGAQ